MAKIFDYAQIIYKADKNGKIIHMSLKTNDNEEKTIIKETPFISLKSHFKHIDMLAKEQIQKAILGGYDPSYIMKTDVEEPVFEWKNNVFSFVPKPKEKKKSA